MKQKETFFLPWSVAIDCEGPVHPVDVDRLNFPISLSQFVMWTFDVAIQLRLITFSNINIFWLLNACSSLKQLLTPPPIPSLTSKSLFCVTIGRIYSKACFREKGSQEGLKHFLKVKWKPLFEKMAKNIKWRR